MQQRQTVICKQPTNLCEVCFVIAIANMLEHAERIDPIELAGEAAIVLQENLHWQTFAAIASRLGLIAGDSHACDLHVIALRSELRSTAPPTADVQHTHPGFEPEFPTDQIELGFLCLLQRFRLFPVSAAIDHS